MATTTPNFGWQVPTSTDYVKDGAVAIETLGDAIDASLVDLKGGTTGQVLSKATNADMDFTWVTQDDANAIQNTIVDAKGDLVTATAADTPARLAVGTNGQVLTADSTTATGLKWAAAAGGSMTLLASQAMSGLSTITFSSISSSYTDLLIIGLGLTQSGSGADNISTRINGITTSSYYESAVDTNNGYMGTLYSSAFRGLQLQNATDPGHMWVRIRNYANATTLKRIESTGAAKITGSAGVVTNVFHDIYEGAVTSVTVFKGIGTFTGGTVYLYGVN